MSENLDNVSQAKSFLEKINRMEGKFKNKDMSDTERYSAMGEITMFNEQLESFAVGFGGHFKNELSAEMLPILASIKKISADLSANIGEGVPASHYM